MCVRNNINARVCYTQNIFFIDNWKKFEVLTSRKSPFWKPLQVFSPTFILVHLHNYTFQYVRSNRIINGLSEMLICIFYQKYSIWIGTNYILFRWQRKSQSNDESSIIFYRIFPQDYVEESKITIFRLFESVDDVSVQ